MCCSISRIRTACCVASLALLIVPATSRPQDATLTTWMQEHAQPFATCAPSDAVDDLAALRRIVGDARIVALGEGTHGTREFFQLKHRIIQYLATEMGFTVFAIEANLPEAWSVNDYVQGGAGDPRALLDGMYFWTWNTAEVLEMIEWMRRFNAAGRGRIEFTGFDMQTPDIAADLVRRFLATHDPVWADSVTMAEKATPRDPGFVTSTGKLPAAEFAGHAVRYSGTIRTENVSKYVGLWMRADVGGRTAVIDNMQSQNLRGTTAWQRHAIELAIPANADQVVFGVLLAGHGAAWFDSLAIEVDGQPWQSATIDLALEKADGPHGLSRHPAHPRFSIAMDEAVAASGVRSLRLTGAPELAPQLALTTNADNERALRTTRRLVQHLEATRTQLGAASTPARADWVIRNAHVVLQHALSQSTAGANVRDSSMAANVVWTAEVARPGAKVVLWAHNGHVAKQVGWMGQWLDDHYGADMVVVGFATNAGTYTAVNDSGLASDNRLQPGPPGSLEAAAHATGVSRFLLDLRAASTTPAVEALLRSGMTMRSIGSQAMDAQFHATPVLDHYDVLAWVDSTEATRCFRVKVGKGKK